MDNQYVALNYLWGKSSKIKPYDFGIGIGSLVRIMLPVHFASGTAQRFSDEIFTVVEVLNVQHPVLFRLTDEAGEPLAQLWCVGVHFTANLL